MFIHFIYTHRRPSQNKLKIIILIKSCNNFQFSGIKNKGISSMIKAEVRKHISNEFLRGFAKNFHLGFQAIARFGVCLF